MPGSGSATTQTISMSPNTQTGLVVCSHNAGILCQAQFAGVAFNAEPKNKPAPRRRAAAGRAARRATRTGC